MTGKKWKIDQKNSYNTFIASEMNSIFEIILKKTLKIEATIFWHSQCLIKAKDGNRNQGRCSKVFKTLTPKKN